MGFLVDVIAAGIRNSTPFALGATGELITERSGVLNLGIEGTMYGGAFFGFWAAHSTGSLAIGLVAGISVGALSGLLLALTAVTLGINQHIAGLGLTIGIIGLSEFVNRLVFGGSGGQPPQIRSYGLVEPFSLGGITEQYVLTYVTFLVIVPLVAFMFARTRIGLEITAVGENPEAADVAGVSVARTRYLALVLGGSLMGLAGAFLTLAMLGTFTLDIISGRGWVCLALVILGRWKVRGAMFGAALFAGVFSLQLRLRLVEAFSDIPFELLLALPYIATLLALVLTGRAVRYPGSYLKPYRRS